ncbi:hypothetical protein NHX12_001084 [Muraenolepis orangiensis]|uniref:Uncharacterized protein n=1 Tax=Muraenolepis orangiensis TaxID=630683 RepID=A0A9Q0DZS9_9TELE|nr:hypothetical protein NHX12_001084 [Muraenolepis orangiensis]
MKGWPVKKRSMDRKLYSYWPMKQVACEEQQLVKRVEALSESAVARKTPSTKEELLQRYSAVIHACRNVPLSIMDPLKETLKDLQERKVITPVSEPSEWVNSLVVTNKKNGALGCA